jgi:hypothetical protein
MLIRGREILKEQISTIEKELRKDFEKQGERRNPKTTNERTLLRIIVILL